MDKQTSWRLRGDHSWQTLGRTRRFYQRRFERQSLPSYKVQIQSRDETVERFDQ
jgi:hypothetical protein